MILVTGGSGLLGSYLLLQLTRKKKQVRVLIRKNTSKKEIYKLFKIYEPKHYQSLYDSLEWFEGDILDIFSLEKGLEGISQIYHAAGNVSFDENKQKELYIDNTKGTKNIINIAISKKIDKFCFISSISTLDQSIDQLEINEESEWNSRIRHSSYACSKYGAEMEVWRATQEGLNVIIVHPGVILGSNNWERSTGLLFKTATKTNTFYTSGTTGYVDAEDVAEICTQLMDSNIKNERYVLVSENASYEKVFELIRNQCNLKPAKKISDFWLKCIVYLTKILPLKMKISKVTFKALTNKSIYSNDKIKKTLNYDFIPLEVSLKRHAKQYKKDKL